MAARRDVGLLAFFLIWAKLRRWKVPEIHVRALVWLESCGELAVLRCFRGFGKSTILGVYNAWRYYRDSQYRILHQSEADSTAYKTSRDTQNVLRQHPLTRGMFREGGVEQWWVEGAEDARNASMFAKGILSNVTSGRADECQNDDVEVPRNIQTVEAREKLRYRLSEQTHILVPGGRQIYVGTPHTHDSLYDEQERLGADCLTIRMFEHEHRIEDARNAAYDLPFAPEYVFAGIFKHARLLVEGRDYRLQGTRLVFASAPGGIVDCYAGCAWPERFTREELEKRRRKTRTINEWDSQYQLHSKPIHDVRLDPDRMIPYEVEPVLMSANKRPVLMLGKVQLVGFKAWWDVSLGKVKSDASALCVVFTDDAGRLYWHRAIGVTGDLELLDARGRLVGGQCHQILQALRAVHVHHVTVETNGPGGFVPPILRKHLAPHGITVSEEHSSENKQRRILDAFEPPLSSKFLWAHVSVLDGPAAPQMREFNPAIANQPDDYLDAGAGAIRATPVRIGRFVGIPAGVERQDWSPVSGSFEVEVEFDAP